MTAFKADQSPETLADGQALRLNMMFMDSAAAGARDAARQVFVDSLQDAWRGGQPGPSRADAEIAMSASLAAVEASQKRLADTRPDAEDGHSTMVARLSDAWRGA